MSPKADVFIWASDRECSIQIAAGKKRFDRSASRSILSDAASPNCS